MGRPFCGSDGVMDDGILGGTTVSWERLCKICQSCAKFVRAVQNLSALCKICQADSCLTNIAGFQISSSHSTVAA
jgi:hypothetical protein